MAVVVLDASAMVDLLTEAPSAEWILHNLRNHDLTAPGHAQAEVLNALGRAARIGALSSERAESALGHLVRMPLTVVPVSELLVGAWVRREQHALADALYVELAAQLDTVVVTTDQRLARATPLAIAPPLDPEAAR